MNVVRANDNRAGFAEGWRKLAKTPMRDLARGRLSGRLDLEAIVERSGLPAAAQRMIERTARAGRMNRLERAEVAAELVAHFADGLEAGRSEGELIREFGDPRSVGKVIAKSRRRMRPWPIRALRRVAAGLVVLIVAYIAWSAILLTGEARPSVDYVAILNEKAVAAPLEEQAWPVYRAVLLDLEDRPTRDGGEFEAKPGEEAWPVVEAWLDANDEALERVRAAAKRPSLGFVAVPGGVRDEDHVLYPEMDNSATNDEGPLVYTVLLPYLPDLRMLGRSLRDDALLAASRGDGERVVADIEAILGLSSHAREIPCLICDLVSSWMALRAVETTGQILHRWPILLTDEQLQRLAHRLGDADDLFDLRLQSERIAILDLLQHIYTDDGHGDGHITAEGLRLLMRFAGNEDGVLSEVPDAGIVDLAVMPAAAALIASRREMLAEFDRLFAMTRVREETPMWKWEADRVSQEVGQLAKDPIRSIEYLPVRVMMPALGRALVTEEQHRTRRDGVLVAIAIELHHRRTGEWPETLDDLVPVLLPSIPSDPFTGMPLSYAVREGRPIVYSVGHDRIDDGGASPTARTVSGEPEWDAPGSFVPADQVEDAINELAADPRSGRRRSPSFMEGDWILWPRHEAAFDDPDSAPDGTGG